MNGVYDSKDEASYFIIIFPSSDSLYHYFQMGHYCRKAGFHAGVWWSSFHSFYLHYSGIYFQLLIVWYLTIANIDSCHWILYVGYPSLNLINAHINYKLLSHLQDHVKVLLPLSLSQEVLGYSPNFITCWPGLVALEKQSGTAPFGCCC